MNSSKVRFKASHIVDVFFRYLKLLEKDVSQYLFNFGWSFMRIIFNTINSEITPLAGLRSFETYVTTY